MQPVIEKNIETIKKLCKEHHVKNLYAFGSAVSGDFTENSDIDLIYEMDYDGFDFEKFDKNPYDPFLSYFDLKEKLEHLFGKKVDLIPNQDFRNKYLKASIEKNKTLLYVRA